MFLSMVSLCVCHVCKFFLNNNNDNRAYFNVIFFLLLAIYVFMLLFLIDERNILKCPSCSSYLAHSIFDKLV
ncbi:uncharacterized protein BX663DRAFT_518311 [Cokeromyces recurvatus]|uniref:uncharacterized protein n=1 Tax=Cokeromyces recurvatus TaxID=90255 RepID=UPI0022212839|nr:uncharacterized protein BX663DRAFT_518311 [Cokeromyces recurvatus]KAI7900337.1 hypothetical protein BX663DRAFT_518311 [Cokeromyces recurvatus]